MGLERVDEVRRRLQLMPDCPVITVGGTNGKGSTCAMLTSIYQQAGYRVGCYTSPHLLRYNERVRVCGEEASDEALVAAFIAIDAARGDTPLTYFEFGTLAAVWHFMEMQVEVMVLEVGLGGRLDAVNCFDPSCAIVTSIDLDHMDFLGNSRDSIGYEKAGIFRPHAPAICGEVDAPAALLQHAANINADLMRIGTDFSFSGQAGEWCYEDRHGRIDALPHPALIGSFQLNNAACVLAAVRSLQQQLPVGYAHIAAGLQQVNLAGRFQQCGNRPQVILDVAHNPHAAAALAYNLTRSATAGRTLAVFAMLADKDISGVVTAIGPVIDEWYVAGIRHLRGTDATSLAAIISRQAQARSIRRFANVEAAYAQACLDAAENDRIIVFGSFFTVADVMRILSPVQPDN